MQRPVVDDHAVIEKKRLNNAFWRMKWVSTPSGLSSITFSPAFRCHPCPETIFGALSRLTKRIRLGFGVVILPYHHPVRVAERVAMIDHMSGGRVDFGTGALGALRADRQWVSIRAIPATCGKNRCP